MPSRGCQLLIAYRIIVIVVVAGALGVPERDYTSTAQIPPPTTIRANLLQHQHPHTLHPRDDPTPTIDFASVPTCVLTECIYPASHYTPLPCPSIPAPCPSGKGTGCSTFPKSCYCNLAKPLECAFHPCAWEDVIRMENWFNATCPDVEHSIKYSFQSNSKTVVVPACAKGCIRDQTISYGCTSESRNCFCSHGSLFGCTSTCSTKENSTVASWFAATCLTSADEATQLVKGDKEENSQAKAGGPEPPERAKPFRWYEKLAVSVFCITLGVGVVVAFVGEWRDKYGFFDG